MIRIFEICDMLFVMNIWLESNIQAHDFIDHAYWYDSYEIVEKMMFKATLFVYEDNEKILGFVGLMDNYIAGIFVDNKNQSKGIGKYLLDYIKERYNSLSLKVYRNNTRAIEFYQRECFSIVGEDIDKNTEEIEYVMNWKCSLNKTNAIL